MYKCTLPLVSLSVLTTSNVTLVTCCVYQLCTAALLQLPPSAGRDHVWVSPTPFGLRLAVSKQVVLFEVSSGQEIEIKAPTALCDCALCPTTRAVHRMHAV